MISWGHWLDLFPLIMQIPVQYSTLEAHDWSRSSLWSYSLSGIDYNFKHQFLLGCNRSPWDNFTNWRLLKAFRIYETTTVTFPCFHLHPRVAWTAFKKKEGSKLSQNGWISEQNQPYMRIIIIPLSTWMIFRWYGHQQSPITSINCQMKHGKCQQRLMSSNAFFQ